MNLIESAEKMYVGAIDSLDRVRESIFSINPDFQLSFKDEVEPVYREYMQLLFNRTTPNFRRLIETQEELKLAELENFLQCGKLNLKKESNKLAEDLTTIHLIDLFENLIVIVNKGDDFHYHAIDKKLINNDIDDLIRITQLEKFYLFESELFITRLKNLYKRIIFPIKNKLPPFGKLVFVADNYFQNIPIEMFHDGDRYLLENYSVVTALTSSRNQIKGFSKEQLKVLFLGVSKFNSNLNETGIVPLPEVEREAKFVRSNVTKIKVFLNQKFTYRKLQETDLKKPFPIVHLSTHGQFSSNPEDTFIWSWKEKINVRDIEYFIKNQEESIKLLVLSACQTAKGDKHSALGLAGVSVISGAEKTIGTLWLVDSATTALIMRDFYKGLKDGLDEAEALRVAKMNILKNPRYSHPYFWAPFILVNR